MNNEEKILGILETMQTNFDTINGRLDTMQADISDLKAGQEKLEIKVDRIETDLESVHGDVIRMEQVHGQKLDALFDGYQQLDGKVTRIEEHVSSQDDMILKRVFPKAME